MAGATPGIGDGQIRTLERRVGTLERLLQRYQNMHVGVSIPGAGQRMTIQVLGMRGGVGGEMDYYLSLADTEQVLTVEEMMKDYDSDKHENWSASFEVVDGSMTGEVIYDEEIERFPDDGADPAKQTFYRLPLIRNGENVTSGGFYQEDTLCLNGKGRQQLLKLG